jgi:tight adherence protein G
VVDFCALFCQGAQREQAKRISDVLNGERYPDTHNYIDYELTVSDMLSDKYIDQSSKYLVNDVNLYTGYGLSENEQFKNIPLTNSLSEIDQINQMKASGDTAAYQGILKGTQLLAAGNPNSPSEDEQEAYQSKVKMLLIFSDGVEVPDPTILQTLVDTGMCDRARSLIPGLYIGFIGIDFDADKIMAFENCVNNKETDIIKVTNLDDLIAKIEELIKNGSKSNGFTKLY